MAKRTADRKSTSDADPSSDSSAATPSHKYPRVIIDIDDKHKKRWHASSEVASLRYLELTEQELYGEVRKQYPQYTIERIIQEGAQTLARRKLAEAHSLRLRGQRTRPGSADKRLERAFDRLHNANDKLRAAGRPLRKVTAYTLSETAKTSWRTAARWIAENVAPPEAKEATRR